jgi:acetylornithine/succinyldiaminopimelate/putrescine aminotransferase
MAKNGLLAKPTHDDIIRLAPALTVNEQQVYLLYTFLGTHSESSESMRE